MLGPSGSGKTTLLRHRRRARRADRRARSPSTAPARTTPASAKRIGFVPQSPGPAAVAHGRRQRPPAARRQPARRGDPRPDPVELLAEVGLADFADAYPHELSGGMQQRVALVRAMALGAPLLLMDEPFAALDEITRADMRHLLARLCEPLATTVLFVTHSIAESVFLSDRVVVLSARPGPDRRHRVDRPAPPAPPRARGRPGVLRRRDPPAGAAPRGGRAVSRRARGGSLARRAHRHRRLRRRCGSCSCGSSTSSRSSSCRRRRSSTSSPTGPASTSRRRS